MSVCLLDACLLGAAGATPVFYAAQEGHLEVLQYLVQEADGSLDLVACEGMTPLLSAAEAGHLDVIRFIVDTQGRGALMATTNDGATAFHYAAGELPRCCLLLSVNTALRCVCVLLSSPFCKHGTV